LESGDDPQDQKQKDCVQQYGSAGSAAGDSTEFDTIRTPGFRFVVPVLVIESFMLGPSAHQRWKHDQ